ncbi:CS012 protein, partial [Thryothorus ludovicianus]|nr:CS012 protein [Thryothorus ludovicianus]
AAEKQKLYAEAKTALKNFRWTDAAQLICFVMSNSTVQEKLLGVLTSYLTKKLKAKIKF